MQIFLPDDADIERAAKYKLDASLLNKTLYSMCSSNFGHDDKEIIKSKLMLIGRAYAAALERRRFRNEKDEDIYELVAQSLKASDIGIQIDILHKKDLAPIPKDDIDTVNQVLKLHKDFVVILERHVQMNKRSLASKYLHFHLPNLVFIYDSIATNKLREIFPRYKVPNLGSEYDTNYSKFFHVMLKLRSQIEDKYGLILNPRQLDQLLLGY